MWGGWAETGYIRAGVLKQEFPPSLIFLPHQFPAPDPPGHQLRQCRNQSSLPCWLFPLFKPLRLDPASLASTLNFRAVTHALNRNHGVSSYPQPQLSTQTRILTFNTYPPGKLRRILDDRRRVLQSHLRDLRLPWRRTGP